MILVVNDTDAYRLEAAIALAAAYPASLTAKEIARRRGVPGRFLARLLSGLARAGIVTTTRGSNGGARLARPPHLVGVGQVLPSVASYPKGGPATNWVARQLEEATRRALAPLTLAELVQVDGVASQPTYEI
jgi:Rrf2 family protein